MNRIMNIIITDEENKWMDVDELFL
jgi:hypothetical protein